MEKYYNQMQTNADECRQMQTDIDPPKPYEIIKANENHTWNNQTAGPFLFSKQQMGE